MTKIKPMWRVAVVFFIVIGIVAFLPFPYFKSPFFDYDFLFPFVPISPIISWLLALVFYDLGRRNAIESVKKH